MSVDREECVYMAKLAEQVGTDLPVCVNAGCSCSI